MDLRQGWHQDKWDRVPEPNVDGLPLHKALSEDLTRESRPSRARQWTCDLRQRQSDGGRRCNQGHPAARGGEIVRDSQGNPIGVFRETASMLVLPPRNGTRRWPRRWRRWPRRNAFQGNHEFSRCGLVRLKPSISTESSFRKGKCRFVSGSWSARLMKSWPRRAPEYRIINEGNKHLTVRGHQETHRRGARPSRCVAARALHGFTDIGRIEHRNRGEITKTARNRHRERIPALCPRHRGSG